jgi:CheY-like chemotaxis protein/two-component sensor histidine kinase
LTNLARLVDDLLDVSRLTRRTIMVKRRRLDIRESVRQAAEALERQALDKGLTIEIRVPEHVLIVEADRVRLEQMVGNVVGNAVKYTPPGGHITVSAAAEDGWVVIRVRDTGLGIAPADLGRVFDLFAQTERALDRSQGGLGIGLTVVRMLAELHGGLAEIFSEGEGKGTEVVIRLPKAEAMDQDESAPQLFAPGGQSRRVLLIEDNKDAAEMLAMFLEQAGHDVLVADRGDTGISAALRHRPDIVICDIGLPGCDGYEVARRLRDEPALASCLLVAITGYGEVADQERSRRAGFVYHLTKPADPGHVLELVTKPHRGSPRP